MQILFVYVPLCVHSLPMPGASQTWGVKRSLRMGFSNTGSSGMAASKQRQAEIPSVHVCVQCDCVPICVCDVRFLMDKPTAGPKEVHLKSFPW